MDYYKEYPIRCKSCNEQIACFAEEFENLIQNMTMEEALNKMEMMMPCSRIAMMNPVVVFFNMENREVIDGYKSTDAIDFDRDFVEDKIKSQTIMPPFSSTKTKPVDSAKPSFGIMGGISKSFDRRIPPRLSDKTPKVSDMENRIQGEFAVPRLKSIQSPLNAEIKSVQVHKPLQQIMPNFITDISQEEYKDPTSHGVPVINSDPSIPHVLVNVGSNKQCYMLTGRTFLAD